MNQFRSHQLIEVTKEDYDAACADDPFFLPDEDAFHLDAMLLIFQAVCQEHGVDVNSFPAFRAAMAYSVDAAAKAEESNTHAAYDYRWPAARLANASLGNEPKPYRIDNVVPIRCLDNMA